MKKKYRQVNKVHRPKLKCTRCGSERLSTEWQIYEHQFGKARAIRTVCKNCGKIN